jgi:hypothetical protein
MTGKKSRNRACRNGKRASKPTLFLYFLLPVGLADVIGETLLRFARGVNRNSTPSWRAKTWKKAAPFQRARQDRQGGSHETKAKRPFCKNKTGTGRLRMYFGTERAQ